MNQNELNQLEQEIEYQKFIQDKISKVEVESDTREQQIAKYGADVVSHIERLSAEEDNRKRDEDFNRKRDNDEVELYNELTIYGKWGDKVRAALDEVKEELAEHIRLHKINPRNHYHFSELILKKYVAQYLQPHNIDCLNVDDETKASVRKSRNEYEALKYRIERATGEIS
jgi:hypothetical protein